MSLRESLVDGVKRCRRELSEAEAAYRAFVYSEDWEGAELYKSDIHKNAYYQKNGICVRHFHRPECKIANTKETR